MAAAIAWLLISQIAGTAAVQGHEPNANQSGLVVVKSGWKKGVRGPDLRPIFDQPQPGRNPNSNDPFQQMQQATHRLATRVEGYYYSATIRNDGDKPVKAVIWDYTIATAGEQSSLTHHQFFSRIDIRPGKHKEIYKFAVTPPTRTVTANKGEARFIEMVVVKAVQYKDGSVWKSAPASPPAASSPPRTPSLY